MKWISVKDRLPMDGQYVLIHGKGGRYFTALFKVYRFMAYNPFHEGLERCEEPTHWMPLPEPPKQ